MGCWNGYIYSPKIIPLAFDDALSYYEQILIINAKLEDLNKAFEELSSGLSKKILADVEKRIDDLNAFLNKTLADFEKKQNQKFSDFEKRQEDNFVAQNEVIEKMLNKFDSEIAEERERTKILLDRFTADIIKLWTSFNEYKISTDKWLVNELAQIYEKIDKYMAFTSGKKILVNNPIKGKNDNLQNTLNDICNYFFIYALSAKDFDSLGLTAVIFDEKEITALEFDTLGYLLFADELYLTKVYKKIEEIREELNEDIDRTHALIADVSTMSSPFDGKVVLVKKVVQDLAFLHMNTLTASKFDELDITAIYFDDLKLTAYDYDWQGKDLI